MFGLSQCSPPTRDVTQVEAKAQTLKMGSDLNLKDALIMDQVFLLTQDIRQNWIHSGPIYAWS